MAYGHQHSTTMTTEANFKRDHPKIQKYKKKIKKKNFDDDDTEEAFAKSNAF